MEKDFRLLTRVSRNYEAGQIKALLEDNNIPSLSKIKGLGDIMNVYTGEPIFEKIDIYVNEEDYERAKEIVGGICDICE